MMLRSEIVAGECIISLLPFYMVIGDPSVAPAGDVWIIVMVEEFGAEITIVQLLHMSGRKTWFSIGNILRDFELMGG